MRKKAADSKKKKALIVIGIVVLLLALVLVGKTMAFAIFSSAKTSTPANPLNGLSEEQALAKFDESFVSYLLWSIGAQRLRNVPFTSNAPKIEVDVSGTTYALEVKKGEIIVLKGSSKSPDIRIITTKDEAIKMIKDKTTIKTSFQSGSSSVEVLVGKTTLLLKGYWSIYNELS
ncbi:MAG: hypothetical protein AABY00_02560 [Nanoarchaeota archaeon]